MQVTRILRYRALRLTLFTRPACSLCDDAKNTLSRVWDRRPFEYDEVDVMSTHHSEWKELYEFDTPVLHVDRTRRENDGTFQTTAQARKLMHRFSEEQVLAAMDAQAAAADERA